jgi:hypothetical protein
MDASRISQKITSWGFVLETKATLARLIRSPTLVCMADDKNAPVCTV